jgi:hypothetical protein
MTKLIGSSIGTGRNSDRAKPASHTKTSPKMTSTGRTLKAVIETQIAAV